MVVLPSICAEVRRIDASVELEVLLANLENVSPQILRLEIHLYATLLSRGDSDQPPLVDRFEAAQQSDIDFRQPRSTRERICIKIESGST